MGCTHWEWRGGNWTGLGLQREAAGGSYPHNNLTDSERHLYAGVPSLDSGSFGLADLLPVRRRLTRGEGGLVMMFTRRQPDNSEQRSGSAEDGTKRDQVVPPRYLFFFRGRSSSLRSAGS